MYCDEIHVTSTLITLGAYFSLPEIAKSSVLCILQSDCHQLVSLWHQETLGAIPPKQLYAVLSPALSPPPFLSSSGLCYPHFSIKS